MQKLMYLFYPNSDSYDRLVASPQPSLGERVGIRRLNFANALGNLKNRTKRLV